MNTLQHIGAFVVQFRSESILDESVLSGRIEHVVSGRTVVFRSRSELVELLDRMVKEVRSEAQSRASKLP